MSVSRVSLAGVVLALSLLASGCTATSGVADPTPFASVELTSEPTSEPTSATEPEGQPTLASLEISSTGLGPIILGKAPPVSNPSLDTVRLDPAECQNGDHPESPVWLANYPNAAYPHTDHTVPAFFVFTENGLVSGVSIYAPEPATAEGAHVGMTRAELLAVHPNAPLEQQGPLSDLYVLRGADGILAFEVLRETHPSFSYEAAQIDTILNIRVLNNASEPLPSATWDGCG